MSYRAAWALAWLVPLVLVCGDLGAPFSGGEVAFESVEHAHFDAFAVVADRDGGAAVPLVVRVQLLGDGADADLGVAYAWLLEHANVRVVPDASGVPLYLTLGDLAATSGRSTLGATLPTGMAVEMRDPPVGACVLVHEVLHFLGLGHVKDPRNIMYPHCSRDMLDKAHLTEGQRERLDALDGIRATTPRGVQQWAYRDA